MKKVIRLTEKDLTRLIKTIVLETEESSSQKRYWSPIIEGLKEYKDPHYFSNVGWTSTKESLGWGLYKDVRADYSVDKTVSKGYTWGFEIQNFGKYFFFTDNETDKNTFEKYLPTLTKPWKQQNGNGWISHGKIDSNKLTDKTFYEPLISNVKNLIKNL